jgi:ribosome-binding protein aMBF1 (putative translation factor)
MSAKTIPFEQVKADLLADPAVKAAYDALETAHQIARLRLARGLSQAELAALVGTRHPSIARLEKGETLPSLAFLRRVAEALGVRLVVRFEAIE